MLNKYFSEKNARIRLNNLRDHYIKNHNSYTIITVAFIVCISFLYFSFRIKHFDAKLYFENAKKEHYVKASKIREKHDREAAMGIKFDEIIRGNPKVKEVALTFDDGPHPDFTPKIVDILWKHNIKATFFVIGKMAEKYPDLIRLEQYAGHLVGNHTYSHVNLTKIPEDEDKAEMIACNSIISGITGSKVKYFRPPGGDYNKHVLRGAMDEKLTTVLWTDDPGDYADPGEKVIAKRLFRGLSNGAIILLHDGSDETLELLPAFIEALEAEGYKFTTVDNFSK